MGLWKRIKDLFGARDKALRMPISPVKPEFIPAATRMGITSPKPELIQITTRMNIQAPVIKLIDDTQPINNVTSRMARQMKMKALGEKMARIRGIKAEFAEQRRVMEATYQGSLSVAGQIVVDNWHQASTMYGPSSWIGGIGYDAKLRILQVELNGSLYTYMDCPEWIYIGLDRGLATCVSRDPTGQNRWWPGKNPSNGAFFIHVAKSALAKLSKPPPGTESKVSGKSAKYDDLLNEFGPADVNYSYMARGKGAPSVEERRQRAWGSLNPKYAPANKRKK
jgi:hypothetical protein